jgi:hypothetical protein
MSEFWMAPPKFRNAADVGEEVAGGLQHRLPDFAM